MLRGMELLMDLALNLLTIVIKHLEKYVLGMTTMFAGIWCDSNLCEFEFRIIIMLGGGQLGDGRGGGGANYNGKV